MAIRVQSGGRFGFSRVTPESIGVSRSANPADRKQFDMSSTRNWGAASDALATIGETIVKGGADWKVAQKALDRQTDQRLLDSAKAEYKRFQTNQAVGPNGWSKLKGTKLEAAHSSYISADITEMARIRATLPPHRNLPEKFDPVASTYHSNFKLNIGTSTIEQTEIAAKTAEKNLQEAIKEHAVSHPGHLTPMGLERHDSSMTELTQQVVRQITRAGIADEDGAVLKQELQKEQSEVNSAIMQRLLDGHNPGGAQAWLLRETSKGRLNQKTIDLFRAKIDAKVEQENVRHTVDTVNGMLGPEATVTERIELARKLTEDGRDAHPDLIKNVTAVFDDQQRRKTFETNTAKSNDLEKAMALIASGEVEAFYQLPEDLQATISTVPNMRAIFDTALKNKARNHTVTSNPKLTLRLDKAAYSGNRAEEEWFIGLAWHDLRFSRAFSTDDQERYRLRVLELREKHGKLDAAAVKKHREDLEKSRAITRVEKVVTTWMDSVGHFNTTSDKGRMAQAIFKRAVFAEVLKMGRVVSDQEIGQIANAMMRKVNPDEGFGTRTHAEALLYPGRIYTQLPDDAHNKKINANIAASINQLPKFHAWPVTETEIRDSVKRLFDAKIPASEFAVLRDIERSREVSMDETFDGRNLQDEDDGFSFLGMFRYMLGDPDKSITEGFGRYYRSGKDKMQHLQVPPENDFRLPPNSAGDLNDPNLFGNRDAVAELEAAVDRENNPPSIPVNKTDQSRFVPQHTVPKAPEAPAPEAPAPAAPAPEAPAPEAPIEIELKKTRDLVDLALNTPGGTPAPKVIEHIDDLIAVSTRVEEEITANATAEVMSTPEAAKRRKKLIKSLKSLSEVKKNIPDSSNVDELKKKELQLELSKKMNIIFDDLKKLKKTGQPVGPAPATIVDSKNEPMRPNVDNLIGSQEEWEKEKFENWDPRDERFAANRAAEAQAIQNMSALQRSIFQDQNIPYELRGMAALIIGFEGVSQENLTKDNKHKVYRDGKDKKGRQLWSQGYGVRAKKNSKPISEEEARKQLVEAVSGAAADILTSLPLFPMNPMQFRALTSLVYNVGGTAWRNSDALKALQQDPPDFKTFRFEVEDSKEGFVKFEGKFNQGLFNRRKREMQIFFGEN